MISHELEFVGTLVFGMCAVVPGAVPSADVLLLASDVLSLLLMKSFAQADSPWIWSNSRFRFRSAKLLKFTGLRLRLRSGNFRRHMIGCPVVMVG